MSAVFQATHLLREARVALKFLSPAVRAQAGAEERFINEAVAASRVDSDHVVKIFDVGRLQDGAPYLVMDFLEGRDLSDVLAREGPRLAVPRAVHFVLQILRALHAAHGAGIVHRDMKPSNCFVGARGGEPDFLRVIDFGISKVLRPDAEQALTGTSSIMGTPLYMSPEQARSTRDVDLRTDLYSTGAILYELLSGRPPHTAETASALLYKIFMTDPDPIQAACPEAPPGLALAVHRALARDPQARFGSAVEMARALAPFADERSAQLRGWLAEAAIGIGATEPIALPRPSAARAETPVAPRRRAHPLLPPTTDMAAFRESDLPAQPPREFALRRDRSSPSCLRLSLERRASCSCAITTHPPPRPPRRPPRPFRCPRRYRAARCRSPEPRPPRRSPRGHARKLGVRRVGDSRRPPRRRHRSRRRRRSSGRHRLHPLHRLVPRSGIPPSCLRWHRRASSLRRPFRRPRASSRRGSKRVSRESPVWGYCSLLESAIRGLR